MRRALVLWGILAVMLALPAEATPLASKIIVYKEARRMLLLDDQGQALKTYKIALGAKPRGHKTQEWDEKTPEGLYFISGRNPESRYHLSLRISYPNEQDVAQALARGVPPGSDIMIHGLPNGVGWWGALYRRFYTKWTDGCIAVKNHEIEEIWRMVPDGTPIEIRP